ESEDLPQVVIAFDKQAEHHLLFNVIWLRLLNPGTAALKDLSFPCSIVHEKTEIISYLKEGLPKELNIFTVSLLKTAFYRKDYSLDLPKARQWLASMLKTHFGEFRDYNGGIIAHQNLIFQSFKDSLNLADPLIEPFFYNIEPVIKQSLLDPLFLK